MFTIKKADENDRFLIHDLAIQIWEHTYGKILPKEQLDYMFDMMYAPEHIVKQMKELHHQYFIVYANSIPSGYLSIEKEEENVYILQKIYALPKLQQKGMGRYMVEQCIDYLKDVHPESFTLKLFVNRENPAVGFYKHLGFYKAGERDFPIGNDYYMNDYIMCLDVSENYALLSKDR